MIEITVKVSDEAQTLKVKHLCYDTTVCLSLDDPILKKYVDQATSDFKGKVQDIVVIAKMIW